MHEGDLEDEFQSHIEMETGRLMEERGLMREEAVREARRVFGNRTQVAEVTREMYSFNWLRQLRQDLHYAVRTLRHSPGFSIAAVLSLALGVGASTAVFSIADTVFLRPLPYPEPGRLVWVGIRFPHMATEFVPSPDYVAWRRDNSVFQDLAAIGAMGTMVMHSPEPAEVHFARVSVNFLRTLGVSPALGRDFTAQEELPNGPKAALLTNQFWRNHFHSAEDAAGRTITLDGQAYTIAGVLSPSFVFPRDVMVDVLTTLSVSPTASHRDRSMATWSLYGRLKPGITLAQTRSNIETLFAASKADSPQLFHGGEAVVARPLQEHRAGNARLILGVLLGAVACLLLIACANVANLQLGRWAIRSRELAIRAAIGAARARLIRQLFTETLLLSALGWISGLALLVVALRGFVHFAAAELPRVSEVSLDARVFAISLLVSLVTLLTFGGIPALRASRADLNAVLQGAGQRSASTGYRILRRALVATEVALSVILLCGAALLLQTLWHLQNDRLGFDPDHMLTVSIRLRGTKLEHRRDAAADEILTFIRRLPGTQAAARAQCSPLSGGPMSTTFSRSDRPLPESFHRGDSIAACGVDVDYFQAAGARLLHGRLFTEEDYLHPDTVTIINEAAARAYFPGEEAVGKKIGGNLRSGATWKIVVGVIADSKNQGLQQPAVPQMFLNNPVIYETPELFLVVRSISPPGALEPEIRAKLRTLDPGLFARFETLDQTIRMMTAGPRFNSLLLASFAGIAFLTALVGVYGVLAFAVTQRTHEIGIRMALGAERRRILGLIAREGAALVAAGSLVGLVGALALTGYLKNLLYGIEAGDPLTYVIVIVGLAVSAAVAIYLPARRAASVDPIGALHHE